MYHLGRPPRFGRPLCLSTYSSETQPVNPLVRTTIGKSSKPKTLVRQFLEDLDAADSSRKAVKTSWSKSMIPKQELNLPVMRPM